MVGIDQWRSAIGLFIFSSRKKKCSSSRSKSKSSTNVSENDDWSDTCGRLFVLAMTFWCFHLQQQCLTQIMASNCFNFDLLKQCHDIESNPGPDNFELAIESLGTKLMSAINEVKKTVNDVKETQMEMKVKLENISDSVDLLKKDLGSTNSRVKDLEEEQHIHRLDIDALCETLAKIDTRVDALEETAEKQEQYSRRENIILHGVSEEQNEDYNKIRQKVTNILNNNVKSKRWQESDILRSHRLGTPISNKIRPIIVRFVQFHDKLSVLKARDELKKIGIGVAGDLTKKQRSELARLRLNNQKGYYKNGVLHITDTSASSLNTKPKS